MEKAEQEAREKLAQCGRALARLGLYGLGGHVSLRVPDSDLILITPGGGLDKERLEPDDLTLVDAAGKHVSGRYVPPRETPIHTVMHAARPELGSVAHLHAHWCTVFSILEVPMDVVLLPATCLGEDPIRTFDTPLLVTTPELGQELNAALGSSSAVLMRWHGITVVGDTLEDMFTRAVSMEDNARLLWEAMSIGKPIPVDWSRITPGHSGLPGTPGSSLRTFEYYANLERDKTEQRWVSHLEELEHDQSRGIR